MSGVGRGSDLNCNYSFMTQHEPQSYANMDLTDGTHSYALKTGAQSSEELVWCMKMREKAHWWEFEKKRLYLKRAMGEARYLNFWEKLAIKTDL